MSDPLYLSRCTIEKRGSLHRVAHLPLGVDADFGVHGPIVAHYGLRPEREFPLPVDHIVAAAGG